MLFFRIYFDGFRKSECAFNLNIDPETIEYLYDGCACMFVSFRRISQAKFVCATRLHLFKLIFNEFSIMYTK